MAKHKLRKFRDGENPRSSSYKDNLNALVNAVNKALNLSLKVRGGRGTIIETHKSKQLDIVIPKKNLASGGGGGGGSTIKRMITTEAAPTDNTILCNFYDSDGIEITTGTPGVDYNIPVWCNISNGEVQKVAHATPTDVNIGDTFRLTVALDAGGTDYVEYTATNTSAFTVSSNLTSLWNAEVGAEFARVTASYQGSYVRLTADNAGEDFDITGSSVGGTLTVTTITANNAFGSLSTATPKLNNGDDIMVTTSTYYLGDNPSSGLPETETRYVCLSNFAATEQCICSS